MCELVPRSVNRFQDVRTQFTDSEPGSASSLRRCAALGFLESSLELPDHGRQGFRLLIRGEVTAGQPLDLEAELAQPFLYETDLPVLKCIFIAPAHPERELATVGLE